MKKFILAVFLVTCTSSAFSSEICDKASADFISAVDTYKNEGSIAYIKRLLSKGHLAKDPRVLDQGPELDNIERFFGPIQDASILSVKPLGLRSCYIIGILEYQNGPAFGVANYYNGASGVGVTSFSYKTEPEEILAREFLAP